MRKKIDEKNLGVDTRFVSQSFARENLLYDERTGTLYDRKTLEPLPVVGRLSDGSPMVSLCATNILVRNAVWAIHRPLPPHGTPIASVDGNNGNTRIENLVVGETKVEFVDGKPISIFDLRDVFAADGEKGVLYRFGIDGDMEIVETSSVMAFGRSWHADRLVFMLCTNSFLSPHQIIDHRNGDMKDNRFSNLFVRRRDNSKRVKGVRWCYA